MKGDLDYLGEEPYCTYEELEKCRKDNPEYACYAGYGKIIMIKIPE